MLLIYLLVPVIYVFSSPEPLLALPAFFLFTSCCQPKQVVCGPGGGLVRHISENYQACDRSKVLAFAIHLSLEMANPAQMPSPPVVSPPPSPTSEGLNGITILQDRYARTGTYIDVAVLHRLHETLYAKSLPQRPLWAYTDGLTHGIGLRSFFEPRLPSSVSDFADDMQCLVKFLEDGNSDKPVADFLKVLEEKRGWTEDRKNVSIS